VAPLETIAYIHGIVKQVATTIKKATNANGISIIQQNGKAAGQEIFHLDIHIIPRHKGQKLPSFNEVTEVNREKLNLTAARIRNSL
jgi:histidine triad (HIT) family protein